jgi:hypothetical protein
MNNKMELTHQIDNYVDFEKELAGDEESSVIFRLTYIKDEKRFYGAIIDHRNDTEIEISDVSENTARFLIGEDAFKALKNS